LKIALDARIIKPWVTGLGRYGYPLLRSLAQIDKNNEYLILKSPLIKHPLVEQENFKEITLEGTPEDPKNFFCHLDILDGENIDIFHSLYHFLPRSVTAKKKVITCHDLIWMDNPFLAFESFWKGLGTKIWGSLYIGRTLRTADAVICISEATKKAILRRYPEKKNLHIVYHGTDLIWHDALRQATAWQAQGERDSLSVRAESVEASSPYFLMVGHTKPYKNAPAAIQALSILHQRHPECHLVFVGRGDYYAKLKMLGEKLKVNEKIFFLDQVSDQDLQSLYKNTIALLQPSFTEGFGFPVVEAMKSGCPVIASNRDSLPELLEGSGLLIDPEAPRDLAIAMEKMFLDEPFQNQCRLKGLARVSQFRWEETARKTLQVYENLMKK